MSEATEAHACALRLRAHYSRAPDEVREAGRQWYPHARRCARLLAAEAPPGTGESAVAAVIATLSPRLRWGHNIADAAAMVRASARMHGDFLGELGIHGAAVAAARYAFPERIRLAADVLAAEVFGGARNRAVARALTGPKVRAFHAAIMGDLDAVTLDVWAARAATGSWAWADNLTPRRRRILTDAYRRAAWMVDENPRNLQAIVWLQVRGVMPSDALAMVAP